MFLEASFVFHPTGWEVTSVLVMEASAHLSIDTELSNASGCSDSLTCSCCSDSLITSVVPECRMPCTAIPPILTSCRCGPQKVVAQSPRRGPNRMLRVKIFFVSSRESRRVRLATRKIRRRAHSALQQEPRGERRRLSRHVSP